MEREKEDFDIPYNQQLLADYLGVDRLGNVEELGKAEGRAVEVKLESFPDIGCGLMKWT